MSHSTVQEHFKTLDQWFTTTQGLHVARAFQSELIDCGIHFQGHHLLQLGGGGKNSWLQQCHYKNKWIATPSCHIPKTTVLTELSQLPFTRNSIDCIIAPLTLEALWTDKFPIDEIDRVLKPMGYVIIMGINPFSFWGLAFRLGLKTCFQHQGTPTSSFKLKRAFFHRGYRQCHFNSFYYQPPLSNPAWVKPLAFLNPMGKMIFPFPAGFYSLILQKYNLITPSLVSQSIYQYFGLEV